MKRYGGLIACGCLLGLTACTTELARDTRPGDIQAVKEVEAAWAIDSSLKDPAKFASYYTDDAAVMFPNSPLIAGRDNIKAALTTMMADPNFALGFEGNRADAARGDDLVYTVGMYSLTMSDPKNKQPVTQKGKYMTVYRKQADGSWKAAAESINSDAPVPGAAH